MISSTPHGSRPAAVTSTSPALDGTPDALARVLADVAEVLETRAVDTGDDATQQALDRAFDAVLERVVAAATR